MINWSDDIYASAQFCNVITDVSCDETGTLAKAID